MQVSSPETEALAVPASAVEAFAPTVAVRPLMGARGLSVFAYRCSAGPGDRPFSEWHRGHALAYIQRGSFACQCRGRRVELTAGSLMVGHPGDEYQCVHDHHACGDEGVSFRFDRELIEQLGDRAALWQCIALPALAETAALGELAAAAARGTSDVALAEIALLLAERFIAVAGQRIEALRPPAATDRRRVLRAAEWIEAHSTDAIDLDGAAAQAGVSAFHFLRLFRRVLGVTPHQYLIRCRLRRAARLLAEGPLPITDVAFECGFGDLSNFVRTFGRAARMSPRRFRALARGRRTHADSASFAKTAPS